jgi:DUF35 OB-fold domain, acyl-CoA-associated
LASAVPYNVAQVDLIEGVRMTSNVVGVANDALRIGMPLQAVFEAMPAKDPHSEIPSRRRLRRAQLCRTSQRALERALIVGVGVIPMGKIYGRRSVEFAAEAIALALYDAGLAKINVDGLRPPPTALWRTFYQYS